MLHLGVHLQNRQWARFLPRVVDIQKLKEMSFLDRAEYGKITGPTTCIHIVTLCQTCDRIPFQNKLCYK